MDLSKYQCPIYLSVCLGVRQWIDHIPIINLLR